MSRVEPLTTFQKLLLLATYVRYKDAIIGQAITIGGLVLYFPGLSVDNVLRALVLSLGSFLLTASLFSINDWADIALDEDSPHKRIRAFRRSGITGREMLAVFAVLALAGLAAVAAASTALLPVGILIIGFGLAYSFPLNGWRGKGIPVLSSCLHFAGVLLAFLLGSMVFAPVDARSLWIGSYFAVLITAGHLVQEVQDHTSDGIFGIQTNAVRFGARPVFLASFVLFTLSFVFLVGLARGRLLHPLMTYGVLLYPVYVACAVRAYRSGLKPEAVESFRQQYRIIFALVVLGIWITALAGRGLLT